MINHGIFTNVASKLGREIVMENQEMVMEKSWGKKHFVKSVGTLSIVHSQLIYGANFILFG